MDFQPLIPEFLVGDIARSLDFYCGALGFSVTYERPEERFAFLMYGDAQLMLLQDNQSAHSRTGDLEYPRGQGANFSIRTSNLATIENSLKLLRHPLRIPIRNQWHRQDGILHGERQLWVMDPDGYLLRFIQYLGTRPVDDS